MSNPTIFFAGGAPYIRPDRLALFDQINLAKCATERAKEQCANTTRFEGEYITAAHWASKRVIIGW